MMAARGQSEVRVSRGTRDMMREMDDFNMKKLKLWRIVISAFNAAVGKRFKEEGDGRQRWQKLSDEYAARKRGLRVTKRTYKGSKKKGYAVSRVSTGRAKQKILQSSEHLRKAAAGQFARGFYAKETKWTLTMGIRGIVYAAIHNFGGKAGRGRSVQIPKRTYFVDDDGRPAMTDGEMEEMNKGLKAGAVEYFIALKNRSRL
jgi:phage gpG-like protein